MEIQVIQIIQSILSGISFLLIPTFFVFRYFIKNNEKFLYLKQLGVKCYSCENDLDFSYDEKLDIYMNGDDNNMKQCLSCSRHSKLMRLTDNWTFDKVKKWVISKNSNKVGMIIIAISLLLLFVSLIVSFLTGIRIIFTLASMFNSTLMIVYWGFQIYRLWICRK